jgi:hypothetical protein
MEELQKEVFDRFAIQTISGKYFVSDTVGNTIYFVEKTEVKKIKLYEALSNAEFVLHTNDWNYVANGKTFYRANLKIVKITQELKTFISKIEYSEGDILE